MEPGLRNYIAEDQRIFRPRPVAVPDTPEERSEKVVDFPRDIWQEKPVLVEQKPRRKVVQYELAFDQQKACELREVRLTQPERYEEEEQAFAGFIRMQLLTALGERYNRGISEFSYRVKDGKLVGEHSDESFEDVLERGRAYRIEHGDPQDHPREAAEVVGFRRMQSVMTDEKTPVGTIVLTVSPPGGEGSIYKHNFYDGYQKQEDGSIRAIRFSSALAPEETLERLHEVDSEAMLPTEATDTSLLSQPIVLHQRMLLEDLHRKLHKDHEYMSQEDFEKVWEVYQVLATSYMAQLLKDPDDTKRLQEIFNAGLNAADDMADALKSGQSSMQETLLRKKTYRGSDFYALAYRPVRAVDTGCGFSGGAGLGSGSMVGALGAFGVAAFSRPEDDPNLCRCGGSRPHFHCPGTKTVENTKKDGTKKKEKTDCSFKIEVGKGITMCPECGERKRC